MYNMYSMYNGVVIVVFTLKKQTLISAGDVADALFFIEDASIIYPNGFRTPVPVATWDVPQL